MDTIMADPTAGHPGHEATDAHAGPIAGVGIAIAVLVGSSIIAMILLFKVLDYYQPFFDGEPHPLTASRQENSGPRVQIDPPVQKMKLREIEDKLLGNYAWVDKERGVARIPISRAMEIVAAKKLNVAFENMETTR
jgi:hypothetical protein